MLESAAIHDTLSACGIDFYAGVPDSLLKHFCAHVQSRVDPQRHIIAANEGAAVALAAGHHLASGGMGLVYMQNSGLGNAINPLMSLADRGVYGIPMLLMIGWRGQPGTPDEPQHGPQGHATLRLLEALSIPYAVLPRELQAADSVLRRTVDCSRTAEGPCALVVCSKTFAPGGVDSRSETDDTPAWPRADVIAAIADHVEDQAVIVATTGHAGRELCEHRGRNGRRPHADFLNVGAMGHASQIALAIAQRQPRRPVYCLDGDGAVVMHLGALAVIGGQAPPNFVHIVLNNGVHDSVGGQPTAVRGVDIAAVAAACGYARTGVITTPSELTRSLQAARDTQGPCLFDVRCGGGARRALGRPQDTPRQRRNALMEQLLP